MTPITDMNDVNSAVKRAKAQRWEFASDDNPINELICAIGWLQQEVIRLRAEAYKPLKDYGSYL